METFPASDSIAIPDPINPDPEDAGSPLANP